MEEKEKKKALEKEREENPEKVEKAEKEPPIVIELPKSVQGAIEQQKQLNRSALDNVLIQQYKSLYNAFEPVRSTIQDLVRYVQQPYIVDAVKRMQSSLNEISDLTEEDSRLKKHSENTLFWENLNKASTELILLPIGLPDEVLDYLNSESCDMEEVKRMIGDFDVMELEKELEDEEHHDYLFKAYLQEILELHKTHPGNYRVSIPALFVVIEGTLGGIFKISEEGMASEIKQKMNVFWDIYGYVYANQFLGSAFSFWSQFFLANTKGVFNQLTVNSKDAGGLLNRNAVLHGKSNPDDWTLEEFETLLSLLHTTLVLRKTVDFMTQDFDAMIHDNFYDEQPLILKEFEQAVPKTTKKGETRTFKEGDIRSMRQELKKDLRHIFDYDEEKLEYILEKSNFHEIKERLLAIT